MPIASPRRTGPTRSIFMMTVVDQVRTWLMQSRTLASTIQPQAGPGVELLPRSAFDRVDPVHDLSRDRDESRQVLSGDAVEQPVVAVLIHLRQRRHRLHTLVGQSDQGGAAVGLMAATLREPVHF